MMFFIISFFASIFSVAPHLFENNRKALAPSAWRAERDVRFWHKADMPIALTNVRLWG